MHTIIRIEHSDGCGMFRSNEETGYRYTIGDSKETERMFLIHGARKSPFGEGFKFRDDMYCAFDSLETFNELVEPEEVQFLLTKDFKVLMIDVSEMLKGVDQVCYKKEHILQTKDISSLFTKKIILKHKK